MIIRLSAANRQNYNEIPDLCRKTAEPVYLTKNGCILDELDTSLDEVIGEV